MIGLDESADADPIPSEPSKIDLAHELNNLLTIVLGSLEQLHRQPLNDRGKSQLERAQLGVQKAGELVKQVINPGGWDTETP